jgi:hypothetical protein
MKNICIFAASSPNSCIKVIGRSYFYGYAEAALSQDIRLSIPCGLLPSRCSLSLATWGRIAFFYLCTLIFHYMPNSMKSESKSKHSTLTLPSFHETELQLQQATSLPEISKVLITLCEQLGGKTELHVHFVINDNHLFIEQINGGNNHLMSGSGNCSITGDDNSIIKNKQTI